MMSSMRSDPIHGSSEVPGGRLNSISLVIVARAGAVDACLLHQLHQSLAEFCVDLEFIIVASGVNDHGLLNLKRLVGEVPDCCCYVTSETMDSDSARLFGMEAALGDYVFLVNADALAEIDAVLPVTINCLQDGFDLVNLLPTQDSARRTGMLEWLGYRFLSKLADLPIRQSCSDLVALTRDAALCIISRPNAELFLKARTAGPGFLHRTIHDAYRLPNHPIDNRSIGERVAKAIGLLISLGAIPVRIVSIVSLLSGVLSLVYAGYIVVVYFSKPNVAPGWTTLSLQLSGMAFLISLMLALLSEYITQIYAATTVRRRRQILRELRAEKVSRGGRLNVADERGVYRLGRPCPDGTEPPS
jgi:hypothetical protein